MGKIARYLNQLTVGNVFDNPEILEKYATDYSALKIKPKFVAFPESTDDIRKLMRFFNQLAAKDIKVAITPRGAGHDTGGAALTNGIIISTEKLNKLLEIDPRDKLVHVQAGITLRELNTALSVSGLTIPINADGDETIGGLISNCPVDSCAGKYGGIKDYIERIEVVLTNGDCLQTNRYKKYTIAKKAVEKTAEGMIYRKIAKLTHDQQNLIEKLAKDTYELSGYHHVTDVSKKETMDLMPLFFGAQGTLGIISEVILRAVPMNSRPMRVVATFKDINAATIYMKEVQPMNPEKLDLYDLRIIREARETGKNLDGVIKRLEEGFVIYACFSERPASRLKKIIAMRDKLPRSTKFIFEKPETQTTLDEFDNSLVNYLSYIKKGERVPILTDFYLPVDNLEPFLKDLQILGEKLELDLALYGSFATGIFSLRPKFDLEADDYRKKVTTFLRAGAYIIDRQGGKLAGGTPEGRLKAVVTNAEIPEPEQKLYNDIKQVFDPNGILNPDVKLGAVSKFTLTHFRDTNQPKIML
ncbi:MAG: FAD-binding oxidoreductase [Candidatus Saccharibacteria bacterium]|nr:FAD-binding oxidoreductase [Candidatus Saccharibacteria bacterium]